ncbi:hypothetical protein [Cylindrospermum sp. FACHB-282]|uniref:hypothetical protein n=1 Tax=Cylindrospermum sp. FACHB-282 TaxID=2692794 RepID=UPI0016821E22|nr:hypothetical protein [Cylindrospermum sp. FACHB-282]MBD2388312.1 hypothetical protein [Cylindrospermum sp. FACHB-282]
MTTVIFVHGTGVRRSQYEETFKLVEQKLLAERPDLTVVPCLWGETLGTKLNAQGASIPLYDGTLALNAGEEEDYEIILWQQLYRDSLYELRVLSLKPGKEGVDNPFGEQPSDRLQSLLESFSPSPELQTKLTAAGIAVVFNQSLQAVIRSQAYHQALIKSSDSLTELRSAVARAIIAQAMVEIRRKKKYPTILIDADLRDNVVESLSLALGNVQSGLGDWVVKPLIALAQPIGTYIVQRQRGVSTNAVSPLLGDVLLYQTRGEQIRAFIRELIAQAKPPVVLLTHSLGGIACVDLLVQQDLSQVVQLVTVGSQAPFLYEINALSSLEFGQPLPAHFPNWLNIYDLRDFLSYIGANVFPHQVQDVQVDSKQPFPRSHGAYWTNPATWNAIIPRIPY